MEEGVWERYCVRKGKYQGGKKIWYFKYKGNVVNIFMGDEWRDAKRLINLCEKNNGDVGDALYDEISLYYSLHETVDVIWRRKKIDHRLEMAKRNAKNR